MLSNYITALIRTGAALLVGYVLSLPLAHPVLAVLGLSDASPATKEKLVTGLAAVLTALYFSAAHAAEKRWPNATWLLASSKQPASYAPAADGTHVITALPAGVLPVDADLNSIEPVGEHAAPDPTGAASSP